MKTIIIKFTVLLFFLINSQVYSQSPIYQWMNKVSPTPSNGYESSITGVVTDATGNSYVIGWVTGTATLGTYTLSAPTGRKFFIAKFNSAGTTLWAYGMGGNAFGFDIAIDNNSNIYVCGENNSTPFDFDPGPGTAIPSGWNNGFVAKYDSNGNYIWAFEGPIFQSLDVDKFGNVFVLADPGSTMTQIQKYNSSGTLITSAFITTSAGSLYPSRVRIDTTGNVYAGLGLNGTCIAGTFTTTSTGSLDQVYIKYNNALNPPLWVKKIGGTGSDYQQYVWVGAPRKIIDIDFDTQQNLYCLGMFVGTVNFGPSTYTAFNGSSGSDNYFAKIDPANGNVLYAKHIAGGGGMGWMRPSGLKVDVNNNIHICGTHYSTMDCDPGPGAATLNAGGFGLYTAGLYYAKYDINGNYLSNGGIGNFNSNDRIRPNAILISSSNIFITGEFMGTFDFDMGPGTMNSVSTTTNGNGFVAKYNYCSAAPNQPSSITGINNMCQGTASTTYSVAAVSGATAYAWTLPGGWTGSSTSNTISATPGSSGGNIFVTANNACGSSSAAVLSITVNPSPTISVNSGSICSGSSFTITPNGASTYTIQGGSSVVSPASNSTYTVSGTSSAGCVAATTATSSVTVVPTPTANAGSPQTITCSNPSVTLSGSGVTTYTWSGPGIVSGGTTATPLIVAAGTYSLVGSTGGCNSNMATAIVNTNTVAPTLSVAASSNSICIGSSATLTANGANTYSWSTSSTATTIVVSPTTSAVYTLTGTSSSNGCSSLLNQSIGVNPLPTVTANSSASLICGPPYQGTVILTAGGANTYTWNTSATSVSISVSPSVTTQYTVTGTDVNGCENTAIITQSVSTCASVLPGVVETPAVTLYPNPTSGVVTVKAKAGLHVTIYNIIGELILTIELKTDIIEIDLSKQANGIYFAQIGSVTKKIIKE